MLISPEVLATAGLGFLMLAARHPRGAIAGRLAALLPQLPGPAPSSTPSATPRLLERGGSSRQATLRWLARRHGIEVHTLLRFIMLMRFAVSLVSATIITTAMLLLGPTALRSGVAVVVSVVIGVGLGVYATNIVLNSEERICRASIARDLPDAMKLLLISLSSGAGLQIALQRVASEMESIFPDVSEELHSLLADIVVLGDYDRAFEALANRNPSSTVSSLVGVIRDSLRHGSPIRSALETGVKMERERSIIRIDQLSNEVPAKITTLTMGFCFPPLLLVIGAPPLWNMAAALSK